MDINKALSETYRKYWPYLQEALKGINTIELGISYPHLLYVFPEYLQTRYRLLVVGQQTGGWGFDNAEYWGSSSWDDSIEKLEDYDFIKKLTEELIKVYIRCFHTEKYLRGVLLPTARKLFRRLNPFSPEQGFVWSNLIKIDQVGKRLVDDYTEKLVCNSFPVLLQEIKITNPDVVVFFTGPHYDERLEEIFPGVQIITMEGFGPQANFSAATLAKVIHGELPAKSFRTYHPRPLNQGGELERVLDAIVEEVRRDC